MAKLIKYTFLKRGETLFYEGDAADNFYILIKGKLGILVNNNK